MKLSIFKEAASYDKYADKISKEDFDKYLSIDPQKSVFTINAFMKIPPEQRDNYFEANKDLIKNDLSTWYKITKNNNYIKAGKLKSKDINVQLKDIEGNNFFEKLHNFIKKLDSDDSDIHIPLSKKDYEVVFKSAKWLLVEVLTWEASVYFGRENCTGSTCVSRDDNYGKEYFEDHTHEGARLLYLREIPFSEVGLCLNPGYNSSGEYGEFADLQNNHAGYYFPLWAIAISSDHFNLDSIMSMPLELIDILDSYTNPDYKYSYSLFQMLYNKEMDNKEKIIYNWIRKIPEGSKTHLFGLWKRFINDIFGDPGSSEPDSEAEEIFKLFASKVEGITPPSRPINYVKEVLDVVLSSNLNLISEFPKEYILNIEGKEKDVCNNILKSGNDSYYAYINLITLIRKNNPSYFETAFNTIISFVLSAEKKDITTNFLIHYYWTKKPEDIPLKNLVLLAMREFNEENATGYKVLAKIMGIALEVGIAEYLETLKINSKYLFHYYYSVIRDFIELDEDIENDKLINIIVKNTDWNNTQVKAQALTQWFLLSDDSKYFNFLNKNVIPFLEEDRTVEIFYSLITDSLESRFSYLLFIIETKSLSMDFKKKFSNKFLAYSAFDYNTIAKFATFTKSTLESAIYAYIKMVNMADLKTSVGEMDVLHAMAYVLAYTYVRLSDVSYSEREECLYHLLNGLPMFISQQLIFLMFKCDWFFKSIDLTYSSSDVITLPKSKEYLVDNEKFRGKKVLNMLRVSSLDGLFSKYGVKIVIANQDQQASTGIDV